MASLYGSHSEKPVFYRTERPLTTGLTAKNLFFSVQAVKKYGFKTQIILFKPSAGIGVSQAAGYRAACRYRKCGAWDFPSIAYTAATDISGYQKSCGKILSISYSAG